MRVVLPQFLLQFFSMLHVTCFYQHVYLQTESFDQRSRLVYHARVPT